RYPPTLADLVSAGLLRAGQVADLREHDVRYRALRGGHHYVLHSGGYGPLVRLLPEQRRFPGALREDPERAADLRAIERRGAERRDRPRTGPPRD
ncbi:MAG: hypothetical protein ABIH26_11625, partial [Candidatus Eisenbacteria bacterium]